MSSEHRAREDGRKKRLLIMGAAGRDFHVFNTVFRNDPETEVVAFSAAQIPGIANRRYPAELAGPHYPEARSRSFRISSSQRRSTRSSLPTPTSPMSS
jgi:predicted GTPase